MAGRRHEDNGDPYVKTPNSCNIPAYRAVRTDRYRCDRAHDGPWLRYDNENDLYQRNNPANKPDPITLFRKMEAKLNAMLDELNDDFPTGTEAIARWGHKKEFDLSP